MSIQPKTYNLSASLRTRTCKSKGFTLIELMVSVVVIAMITAVVVYNQGDFADRISLANTASDLELQIREAQVYGVSVREFQPSTNEFNFAYGISFNLNAFAGTLGPTSFVAFADRVVKDGRYATPASWGTCTVGGTSECLKIYMLSRKNSITDLCVINNAGSDVCSSQGSGTRPGRIDLSFLRPDPSANMSFVDTNGSQTTFPGHKGMKVKITSPKGNLKTITVYTTGQIAVQ